MEINEFVRFPGCGLVGPSGLGVVAVAAGATVLFFRHDRTDRYRIDEVNIFAVSSTQSDAFWIAAAAAAAAAVGLGFG